MLLFSLSTIKTDIFVTIKSKRTAKILHIISLFLYSKGINMKIHDSILCALFCVQKIYTDCKLDALKIFLVFVPRNLYLT